MSIHSIQYSHVGRGFLLLYKVQKLVKNKSTNNNPTSTGCFLQLRAGFDNVALFDIFFFFFFIFNKQNRNIMDYRIPPRVKKEELG